MPYRVNLGCQSLCEIARGGKLFIEIVMSFDKLNDIKLLIEIFPSLGLYPNEMNCISVGKMSLMKVEMVN